MPLIPLRNRRREVIAHAIVDDADYEWAMQWRWHLANGYVQRSQRDGSVISLHRELLGLLKGDRREGDHKDGNPLNNLRSNLRVTTRAQNGQNVRGKRNTSSKHRGVGWQVHQKKWQAYGCVRGVQTHLGLFDSEDEAAEVARNWRRENHPFSVADQ